MAPLEPWEKVLVDPDFLETSHGQIVCTQCHQGQFDAAAKEDAHLAMVARPSDDYETICGDCHDTAQFSPENLHSSQQGYWTSLEARGADLSNPVWEEMFGNHCASCHTTCGDCHVSQPTSVGGGFIEGHQFNKTPSLSRNCTACHGSRVGNEYMGKHEDLQADVHFRQYRMTCVDCHTGEQMHDPGAECLQCHDDQTAPKVDYPDHRLDGIQSPSCESCHPDVNPDSDNLYHQMHTETLACQVCHSISYTSCDSCHVSISETTGKPKFSTAGSYLTFLIGKNPLQNAHRPYDYVLLRHVPVDPDSFSFYGENLLPNFDALSTWVYATPHNIQLHTPQTESCDSCHNNAAIFLTLDKIDPAEVDANAGLYLEEAPAP